MMDSAALLVLYAHSNLAQTSCLLRLKTYHCAAGLGSMQAGGKRTTSGFCKALF
jgi:hypothetical protein